MIRYWIRKLLSIIPIIIGVNLITFVLFFMVNTPDDMARHQLGEKHVTQEAIDVWKHEHGYDLPLLRNTKETGLKQYTNTLFVKQNLSLLRFDFGQSDQGRSIGQAITTRMWPSLALAIPSLLIGLAVNITLALCLTLFHHSWFDRFGTTICVTLMSISSLFYIIFGQYVFAKLLKWAPLSGYESGWQAWRFLLLPIAIAVLSGIGSGVRWYRSLFLEEISKDYVRTARAKGITDWRILSRHVLPNAFIPILTGIVVLIPMLFMGSLIMESFFGIPGLGSYTIDAIAQQDFAIVRSMVYLGTLTYILGLLLTDFSYALADPRVRLAGGKD